MANKQLNGRQELFKDYYCEGETAGNVKQSMLKAGYTPAYAEHSTHIMMSYAVVKEAITARKAEIEQIEQLTIESINQGFADTLALCILANDRVNMCRVLENQAKHVGYYEKDNAQSGQQRELSESEADMAKRIAAIVNREGIKLHELGAEKATG